MWEQLGSLLAVFTACALPLAWGLGAEYVFELLRRRRARGRAAEK